MTYSDCGTGKKLYKKVQTGIDDETRQAIFEKRGGQNDRAPKPGDPVQWHKEYKTMKDEEQASNWVGQDHLNQYFGNSQHDGSYGSE